MGWAWYRPGARTRAGIFATEAEAKQAATIAAMTNSRRPQGAATAQRAWDRMSEADREVVFKLALKAGFRIAFEEVKE